MDDLAGDRMSTVGLLKSLPFFPSFFVSSEIKKCWGIFYGLFGGFPS